MFIELLSLSCEQQQKAVKRIYNLISNRMSNVQAITIVAKELRAIHANKHTAACTDDDKK